MGLTNCSKDCELKITTCRDTVPEEEICLAYFDRWFYMEEKNKCEQIKYSGCSQKGFSKKQECEECKCR
jgi:hypothetical protein